MRAEYESKIQQLEARLVQLATAQEQTSRSTENAVQLATSNRKLLTEYATTPRYDAIQAPLEGYAKGFEFHGYLRSGFGLNERGDKPQTFRAPFALGRYRLGNEPDTYGEFIFVQNWLNPDGDKDKAWFKTEVMIQAMLGGPENFDQPTDLRVREAFAEAGNLLPGRWRSTKFWAGSRYYLRQDIHTLDYFFRDMSRIGGGIQEIPVGPATLDVAYIGSTHPTSSFLQSNPPKSTIDFRLAKIKVPGGRGAVWYDYTFSKVNQVVNGVTLPSADGHAFGIEHRRDEMLGGYNLFTVQAGTGVAANLTPTTQDPTPFWQQSRRDT
jgi:maltoporin